MTTTDALPLLVVLGATGNQGGSVVSTYLSQSPPTHRLRGISRNASSQASQALISKGVEMVTADLDDVPSLQRVFDGASVIFGVTDFWGPYHDPKNRGKGKEAGMLQNEWAYHKELQQCKNIFEAASEVPSLRRLVYSSLADTTGISKDKYQHVYHFASKAHALNFARTEYPELVRKTSVIQIGGYLSNFITAPGFAPTKNEASGKFEFVDPFPPGVKIPLIAAEEDTGPLVRALIEESSVKNLLAVRKWMSINDFAVLWSKTLDKEIEIKDPKDAAMPQGLDEEAAALMQEMGETMQFIVDFGFAGEKVDKTVITPDKLGVSVKFPSVEDWVAKQDWSVLA